MSHLITTEPELFADPTDQAAADHELDVSWSVKMRTVEKLRRIEQALISLRERSYGICRRCGQEIPCARLKVQPDSLYCVHCQTMRERRGL
ncbi:MAG TPA: TraR/DksA family transcriptional regulator [Nitrospiraceae bacterium]|nr:TraR/DksA family transcriptional regulator [Nitrospiraceae bacterium]